jgi:phosphoribosylformylglycinamidine synthase
LADEAPVYNREAREPEYLKAVRGFTLTDVPDTKEPERDLKGLLGWPTIASKNWIYRQYDHMVRDGTIVCPGSDAAVIRIKADSLPQSASGAGVPPVAQGVSPSEMVVRGRDARDDRPEACPTTTVPEKLIALTVDCNATYVYLDPYEGGKIAVAEAARNLACSGAAPLGTTDNLNFGNPHNAETFWQMREAVRGVAEACRAFNAPVTGGNVSLYNQSPGGPIDPTPTVAMVGLIERPEHITTQWFKDEGDAIILLGNIIDSRDPLLGLGGSAYLQRVHGLKTGTPPRCNLDTEKDLNLALRGLIHSGVVKSAHDCSEGGLAVALAESCISQQIARETPRLIGAELDLSIFSLSSPKEERVGERRPLDSSPTGSEEQSTITRLDALLFGETQGRVVISVAAIDAVKVLAQAKILGVKAARIGTVGGTTLQIKAAGCTLSSDVSELHDLWWNSIARAMK